MAQPFTADPFGKYGDALNLRVLDNNTWEQIDFISRTEIVPRSMTAQQVADEFGWNLGDTKEYATNLGFKYTARLIGILHDDLTAGGKAGMTFQPIEVTSLGQMQMGSSNSNGWNGTLLRSMSNYNIALAPDLKAVIKAVNKLTANNGSQAGAAIVASSDFLFQLSLMEIWGVSSPATLVGEGIQYAYWAVNNSSGDKIKLRNGIPSAYWTRSPSRVDTTSFIQILTDGNYGVLPAGSNSGVCLAFCV